MDTIKLRIISDGTFDGTRVLTPDGRCLPVTKIDFHLDNITQLPVVSLELLNTDVDVDALLQTVSIDNWWIHKRQEIL